MFHRCVVHDKGGRPDVIESGTVQSPRGLDDRGLERRDDPLAVALTERNKPHGGGYQVGRHGVEISQQSLIDRNAVTGRRGADRTG